MLTKNMDEFRAIAALHISEGRVSSDHFFWDSDAGKGCLVGCLTHSSDMQKVTERFGIPLETVQLCSTIFDALAVYSEEAAINFFGALGQSLGPDGKDLSEAHWHVLSKAIRRLPFKTKYINYSSGVLGMWSKRTEFYQIYLQTIADVLRHERGSIKSGTDRYAVMCYDSALYACDAAVGRIPFDGSCLEAAVEAWGMHNSHDAQAEVSSQVIDLLVSVTY